jgi:ADP-ribose pyrophosphatase YjhB (NUDIX family)
MQIRLKVGAFVVREPAGLPAELLLFTHVDIPEAPIQIPGGSIEPGEDPYAAAQRELHEEAGVGTLPPIRPLGVSEVPSIANANEVLRRHCYLFDGTGLPDHWIHTVTGAGQDNALRFEYRWHRIVPGFTLTGDLNSFLNPSALPELYAAHTLRPGSPLDASAIR